MPETPNHGYNVPNEGEQDWHVPLNENFEQYDTDIEIRDEESNLDDYTPKEGAKFLSTNTEAVYIGDGSNWNKLATSGENPRFAGLDVGGDGRGVGYFASPDGNYALYAESEQTSLGSAIIGINTGDAGDGIQAVSENDGRSALLAQARANTDYGVYSLGDVRIEGGLETSESVQVDGSVSIGQVGAKAELTSSVSIPNDANTVIPFDNVVFDDRSEYSTDDHEFVAATDGRYHVITQLNFDLQVPSSDAEFVKVDVLENGASNIARDHMTDGSPGQFPIVQTSVHLELSAGDSLAIETRHKSNGSAELLRGWFSVVRLG